MYKVSHRQIDMYYAYDNTTKMTAFKKLRAQFKDEYYYVNSSRTRLDYRKLINKELEFSTYIYREVDFNSGLGGRAYLPFFHIQVSKHLSDYDYVIVLAHEILHHKLFCSNEAYVEYETFVHLYESADEELHQFAIRWALDRLWYGFSRTEYDCTGKIIEYILVMC